MDGLLYILGQDYFRSFVAVSQYSRTTILTVATYPFAGGRREGSWVHLPREENARNRHQLLFEENVEKIGKDVIYEL